MSDSATETTEPETGPEVQRDATDSAATVRKLNATPEEYTQDAYLKYFEQLIRYLVADGTSLLMIQTLHRQPEELSLQEDGMFSRRRRLLDRTLAQLRHENHVRGMDNAISAISEAIAELKEIDLENLTWEVLVEKRSLLLVLRPYFVGVPLTPEPYIRYNGMLTTATAKQIRRGRVPDWLVDPWATLSSRAGLPDF